MFFELEHKEVKQENIETNDEVTIIDFKVGGTSSYDINDYNSVYNNSNFILSGKVIDKKEAFMIDGINIVFTPIEFEVKKVLKGDMQNDKITVLYDGGMVDYNLFEENMIKNLPELSNKKGFSEYSNEKKENTYINYIAEGYAELEEGNEYILFLNQFRSENEFIIVCTTGILSTNSEELELKDLFESQFK